MRHVDTDAFHRDLAAADWITVFAAKKVVEKWELFSSKLRHVMGRHAPFRDVRLRNPVAPPVSDHTRDLVVRRGAALRDGGHDSAAYRQLNREVLSSIHADSRRDIFDCLCSDGPGALWRHMHHLITDKRPGQCVLPAVTAKAVNDYFAGVGPRLGVDGKYRCGCRGWAPVRLL